MYDVKRGRRHHEITIQANGVKVDKTLSYLANNLLQSTINTESESSEYQYDRQVARRTDFNTKTSQHKTTYTNNGWIDGEFFRDEQGSHSSTSFALNPIGLATEQRTYARNKDESDGYDDLVTLKYVELDTDKIVEMSGKRTRVGGDVSYGKTKIGYDPNGNTEIVLGDNQPLRRFINNSNGCIVQKTVGEENNENYFYSTTDQPLARFGNIPAETSFAKELTNVDFDLGFHATSEHFPPPAPSQCTVMEGDTFSLIAERMYGDSSFANVIADANGYRPGDEPPIGLLLTIPNILSNLHNWEGIYPLYNPTAIIGSLYPNMPMPTRPPIVIYQERRTSFWHILVEAIVGAAIMTFAPEFATIFTPILNQFLARCIGFAIAGAVSSFAQQEIAIGFGDQQQLSWTAIGQSALLSAGTAVTANVLGVDVLNKTSQYRVAQSAIKNIELTLASQGLSFVIGQQRHFDWRVMVGSLASTLASVGVSRYDLGHPIYNEALATASSTVTTIGIDKMLDGHMNTDAMVASVLGTMIGNQLAAGAKHYYSEYQLKKQQAREIEAKARRSQIPEIGQSLAHSEREFIDSVLAHPHEHGKASLTSLTNSHSNSQNKVKNNSVHKSPPHEHLAAERAREEKLINQHHVSKHGFWSKNKNINNSNQSVQTLTSNKISHDKNLVGGLLGSTSIVGDVLYGAKDVDIYSGMGLFRVKHKYDINYNALLLAKNGDAYRKEQIKSWSRYYQSPGSPIYGDASLELQIQSIDAIITAAKEAHLNWRDTAHVLAIARTESGFNPYAAAGETSASGLGQFTKATWNDYHLPQSKIWDIETQANALVQHFQKCQIQANKHHVGQVYVYKYHHDGLYSTIGTGKGLELSKREVYPQIDAISESIRNTF